MSQPLGAFRLPENQTFLQSRKVEIVDQLLLPHTVKWDSVETIEQAYDAIKSMKIRGAPAIASLAALGIAAELLTLLDGKRTPAFTPAALKSPAELCQQLLKQTEYLLASRPTAVNLREGLERIEQAAKHGTQMEFPPRDLAKQIIEVAVLVWSEDKERNVTIGDNGASWILSKLEKQGQISSGDKISVLTASPVCNTGSLATSGYGTALGVITSLHKMGRLEHAYFAQTGPYQQGARLTSLELASLGIENTMVCDTAIGALIAEKRLHLFVAGADRIASNGDTANKISTYQISMLCSNPHPFSPNPPVPVLVAAPVTTLDLSMDSGKQIVIEQRPSWEACTVRGRVVDVNAMAKSNGLFNADSQGEPQVATVLITPPNTQAWNPAFDVTPASLIAGIVTELGVAEKLQGHNVYDLRKFVAAGSRQA
ncbi:S-methyl-5-thioribose-1-phosphate isomerase [Microbotryomycetes sp. JL221]|nr:S-methyl-5-thioribose-1-phosphate isomerase [Microbotryomycetes sp. JL221]